MSSIVYIPFIKKCPICNEELSYIIDPITKVERVWCLNENCAGKALNRIDYFFGKKGLNVKGLSKATIEKLIDWGWVEDIPDIFTLGSHRTEWIKKSGFGVKSVDNILAAIEAGRYIALSQIISAIGIPKVGTNVAKILAENSNNNWHDFTVNARCNAFLKINGIGAEICKYIRTYDYRWVDELIEKGILIIKEEAKEEVPHSAALQNQSIVITGKLSIFKKRSDLEEYIKNNGGAIGNTISSKTTLLINNDKNSQTKKNIEAKEKNVPIVTEQEFLHMFQLDIS